MSVEIERADEQVRDEAPQAVLGGGVNLVLFLGLGGTGKEVLSRLKQRLCEVNGGQLPSSVALFVIDVDNSEQKQGQALDSTTEYCQPIGGNNSMEIREEIRRHERDHDALWWIAERLPPNEMTLVYEAMNFGTERYRQAGLLAFLWEELDGGIRNGIEGAIRRLVTGAQGQVALQVFLVCSICGGTGSGMVLDAALLARSIGIQNAASCEVSAVLLLPGVFKSVVSPSTYQELQRNALATLTEIEYYMYPQDQRAQRTCDPLDVDWAHRYGREGGTFDTGPGLMQSVFLIDNHTNDGGSLGGVSDVIPAVADILLHVSGAVIGDRLLEPLNNAKTQFRQNLEARQMAPDLPHFSSLGLARIVLPVGKLALEATPNLSAAVLERLVGVAERPSDAVVADALRVLGLEPGVLADELGLTGPTIVDALTEELQLHADVRRLKKIAVVSARIGEITGQRADAEAIRKPCLDAIQAARDTLRAPVELANTRRTARTGRAEEHIRDFVNASLTAARKSGRGLKYVLELLDTTLVRLDGLLTRARLDSSPERDKAAARSAALERYQGRLRSCRPVAAVVKATATQAGRACDQWLNDTLDYELASARARIYEDYQMHLRTASRALRSLLEFLGDGGAGAFSQEVDRAIARRIMDWERNSPRTDINIQASGQALYLAAANNSIRNKVTADCVASVSWSYGAGIASLVWTVRVPAREVKLTVGHQAESAQAWVKHLETFAALAFAGQRLDDHISDSAQADSYANKCKNAAKAFIRYNRAVQQGSVGDPVTITVIAPPTGTKLEEAFRRLYPDGVVSQDKDPTSAVFLTAEVGIVGKALQFREQATVLETSTVASPGLWLLGQVSHNVFWSQEDRWSNLGLFFENLAAYRIIQRPVSTGAFKNPRSASYDYYLVLSAHQETKLGSGIQQAILAFCKPGCNQHRARLRAEGYAQNGSVKKQSLSTKKDEYLKLIDMSGEVPSKNFRRILRSLLETIEQ